MSEIELADLVAKAREELPYNLTSFEKLARLQFNALRALAYAIVRDDDLAGGIAQDALLRIMTSLPKLESVAKYRSWSRRITVNLARSRLAKERRESEKRYAFAQQADWLVEPQQDSESFSSLIKELDVDERTIVTLKILDDLEFSEISEITGLGLSATKMRYYRALDKLKKTTEKLG